MTTIQKKKFYFLRHGKTDWNDKQLCQGQQDIPLNAEGREEVVKICPLIAQLSFDRIVTSSLSRALETAQIIQAHTKHSLTILEELQERAWGSKEGIPSAEMYAIEVQEESRSDYISGFGIEERQTFKKRIIAGINESLKDKTPLIVSHGRVFLVLLEILGLPIIRQIPNSTVIECIPSENDWILKYHTLNS